MQIDLRFFASVREALNVAEERVEIPAGITTVGDVRQWLCARGPVWAETLGEQRSLRMALNHTMVPGATRLTEGCEVAFFPPVTGG